MSTDFRKRILFYYNKFAAFYDWSEFFRHSTRGAVVQASGCRPGDRVQEICSGTCELALAFSRSKIHTVAVDLAPEMLQLGKRKSSSNELACIEADALELPFARNSFTAVAVSLALHHMPEAVQVDVLMEMARLATDRVVTLEWHTPSTPVMRTLKGLLIRLMDVSEHLHSWVHQDFPASCRMAGLEVEREEVFTAGFHRLKICSPVN